MFNAIHLDQFFSFRESEIECNPGVNLLVGINGSGKSNLLKAIRLVKEAAVGSDQQLTKLIIDQWGGFDNIYHYGATSSVVRLTYKLNHMVASEYGFHFTHPIYYELGIHKMPNTSNYYLSERLYQPKQGKGDFIYMDFTNGKGVLLEKAEENSTSTAKTRLVRYNDFDNQESVLGKIFDSDRYKAVNAIRRMLSDITVYDYFNTTPDSRIRKPILPSSATKLLPDGSNLAQVLNLLKIQDKSTDRSIREALHRINPSFRDYDFNFIGGNIELMLSEDGLNRSIHSTHISDGTLRFLCLLAILLNPKRGKLICIDEPEVGLHPDMLLSISEAIEQAGKTSQVFIATHSEHILNQFSIPDIKVIEKNEINTTTVKAFQESDFEGWYDSYLLGNMWRQGDLGGNRY